MVKMNVVLDVGMCEVIERQFLVFKFIIIEIVCMRIDVEVKKFVVKEIMIDIEMWNV